MIKITPNEIKKIREAARLSQDAFARKLEVTVDTVRSWETGRRTPHGPAAKLIRLFAEDKF